MIDCDLKESTTLALKFQNPHYKKAQLLYLMTLIFIKVIEIKVSIVHSKILKSESKYKIRRIFDYGYAGRAFIVKI